jgi:hypothetical protein
MRLQLLSEQIGLMLFFLISEKTIEFFVVEERPKSKNITVK